MKKILIVDDDSSIVEVLKIILEEQGYETFNISEGAYVSEVVGEEKPDLILLDMMLPGISGVNVCKQLKTNPLTLDIPIILFSASTDIDTVWKESGADDYVAKPFDIDNLMGKILKILDKPNYISVSDQF